MGEKKVMAFFMFVMAYGLAVTIFSASDIPPTCNGNEELLTFCGRYLTNMQPNPSPDCCKGTTASFKRTNTPQGTGCWSNFRVSRGKTYKSSWCLRD
ncbi:hypothetical protein CR513_29936, partial [Mucuna pruriens]